MMTTQQAADVNEFTDEERLRFARARFEILRSHCRPFRQAMEAIELQANAREYNPPWGFPVRREDFELLFHGQPVGRAREAGLTRLMVRVDGVPFYCIVNESPEESINRLMEGLPEERRTALVGDWMSKIGGEKE